MARQLLIVFLSTMETKLSDLQLPFSRRDWHSHQTPQNCIWLYLDIKMGLLGRTRELLLVLCKVWQWESISAQSHYSHYGCMQLCNMLPCPEMMQWTFKVSLLWLLLEIFKIQLDKALGSLVWPPGGSYFIYPVALGLYDYCCLSELKPLLQDWKAVIHNDLQFSIQTYLWHVSSIFTPW